MKWLFSKFQKRQENRNVPGNRLRSIQAGMGDRFTEKWTTFPVTADAIIQDHWRVLVARSRDQSINNDYAKRFIKMCKQSSSSSSK